MFSVPVSSRDDMCVMCLFTFKTFICVCTYAMEKLNKIGPVYFLGFTENLFYRRPWTFFFKKVHVNDFRRRKA